MAGNGRPVSVALQPDSAAFWAGAGSGALWPASGRRIEEKGSSYSSGILKRCASLKSQVAACYSLLQCVAVCVVVCCGVLQCVAVCCSVL